MLKAKIVTAIIILALLMKAEGSELGELSRFFQDYIAYNKIREPSFVFGDDDEQHAAAIEFGKNVSSVFVRYADLRSEDEPATIARIQQCQKHIDGAFFFGRDEGAELIRLIATNDPKIFAGIPKLAEAFSGIQSLNLPLDSNLLLYNQTDDGFALSEEYRLPGGGGDDQDRIRQMVASWSNSSGLTMHLSNMLLRRFNMQGTTLRVTTQYQNRRSEFREVDGRLTEFRGLYADVLGVLGDMLNFETNVSSVGNGSDFGTYDNATGEWDGMVGELVNGSADIAAAGITKSCRYILRLELNILNCIAQLASCT